MNSLFAHFSPMFRCLFFVALCAFTAATSVNVAAQTLKVSEFYNAEFDYYFMSSRTDDKLTLDSLQGWSRTGFELSVDSAKSANTSPIYRFFFPNIAQAGKRGSHFYTALEVDKNALVALNPDNSLTPGKPNFEGVDAYIGTPNGGQCLPSETPVYRVFRGEPTYKDDGNHRFTSDPATHQTMVSRLGWLQEGTSFCAKQNDMLANAIVGRFSGNFSGGDAGSWTAVVNRGGVIRGYAYSNNLGSYLVGWGRVNSDGNFSLALSGATNIGATFVGSVSGAASTMSGTWQNTFTGVAGAFSGAKAANAGDAITLAGPYRLTYSGLDSGSINLLIDNDGSVVSSISSKTYGATFDGLGIVDASGAMKVVLKSPNVYFQIAIGAGGTAIGQWYSGANSLGTVTGSRR